MTGPFLLEADAEPAEAPRAYMAKSKRSDTNTPGVILTPVLQVFGGAVDLDPCGNPTSIVGASLEYWFKYEGAPLAGRNVVHGSGLALPWHGRVFVNPPYDHLTKWVRKCAGEHELRSAEVLLLCPARTDVRWFHAHIPSASAVCLWRGRFPFLREKHGCPFPPMVTYWGPHIQRFREAFGPHGLVFRP